MEGAKSPDERLAPCILLCCKCWPVSLLKERAWPLCEFGLPDGDMMWKRLTPRVLNKDKTIVKLGLSLARALDTS